MRQKTTDTSFEDFLAGDEQIWDQIVLDETNKLLSRIMRYVKTRCDAEDILQNLFIEMWSKRMIYENFTHLLKCMYIKAKDRAINFINKKGLELVYVEGYTTDFNDDIAFDGQSIYEAKELDILIELAVNKMPKQRRKVFIMSRYDGLKRVEIATKLEISPHTVSVHLLHAMDDIKKIIS